MSCLLIEEHMDHPEFGVDMLAKTPAMSQPVLYKKLKAVTDLSVNDFIKTLRLKKAAGLLKQKSFAVYEVAYAAGYSNWKYFAKSLRNNSAKRPASMPA